MRQIESYKVLSEKDLIQKVIEAIHESNDRLDVKEQMKIVLQESKELALKHITKLSKLLN